jgi:hypothetical protein
MYGGNQLYISRRFVHRVKPALDQPIALDHLPATALPAIYPGNFVAGGIHGSIHARNYSKKGDNKRPS